MKIPKLSKFLHLPFYLISAILLSACGGGGDSNSNMLTISGTVSGLTPGQEVVLENNGINVQTATANGNYAFSIPFNGSYNVTVRTQPTNGQVCSVLNSTGINVTFSVDNVDLACNVTSQVAFTGLGGDAPGEFSSAELLSGDDGFLYGTTMDGGANGLGTVFKFNPRTGQYSVLYSFTGAHGDGENPATGLVFGNDGLLYGTTLGGGVGGGTVFRVDTVDGSSYETLYLFSGSSSGDGAVPLGTLFFANDGYFYGTTLQGGPSPGNELGIVYRINSDGFSSYQILHYFTGGANDGANPRGALVIAGNDGFLYGTTFAGGSNNQGTVYKVNISGTVTVLHSFAPAAGDGGNPAAALLPGPDGFFYGTTSEGGGTNNEGTVFKISTTGAYTKIHSFNQVTDGFIPFGALTLGSDGLMYGTTSDGGVGGNGNMFKISTTGSYTSLLNFTSNTGAEPVAGLVIGPDGHFYGTTTEGGAGGFGTIFRY